MYLQQNYTHCPTESAYFIESDGEAIVVDPLRNSDEYLKFSKGKNAYIKFSY